MQISDDGLRLIKSFEGYLDKQSDGSCVAYLCPAGVPTLGWGCTEGVKLGMRWTEADAEAALRREIAKFEAGVARLVTVEINQNEFDALVSFHYNTGGIARAERTRRGVRLGCPRASEPTLRIVCYGRFFRRGSVRLSSPVAIRWRDK